MAHRPKIMDIKIRDRLRKAIDNKKLLSNDTTVHPLVLLLTHNLDSLPKGQFTEKFIAATFED